MKVLMTGVNGQLGRQLLRSAPPELELVPLTRQQLNLQDPEACRKLVLIHRPDWVLNAGAYTAVDRAETEPELAIAVNAAAPQAFAEALLELGGDRRLLQISTDFVFGGDQGRPYKPEDSLNPLGVYGRSKASGEEAVLQHLGPERAAVLRTSWVYGPEGSNFLLTMLRLQRERSELAVVADQLGCPTATPGLARACWRLIERRLGGIWHWSDAGAASWYDFALAIAELALQRGLLSDSVPVRPIPSSAYPTPAQRPSYSLLDCVATREALDLEPQHWRQALADVLSTITKTQG